MRLALPSADTLSCTITYYVPRKKQDLEKFKPTLVWAISLLTLKGYT